MKAVLSLCCLLFIFSCNDDSPSPRQLTDTVAQHDTLAIHKDAVNPYAAVDLSPMDISYFPEDYPVLKMSGKVHDLPLVRVIYSRPHRQGRKIFGELLKFGQPWRLGANEATEIEFFKSATIQGQAIPKGRYILYCVPQADHWVICLNTNIYSWGLKHDAAKDVKQFTIPVTEVTQPVEYFTLVFKKNAAGADMVMTWDKVEARLPISF
jgi:hypothetical protein